MGLTGQSYLRIEEVKETPSVIILDEGKQMKKLTLILSLLLASCFDSGDNPTTPPPPLTWENEDLAGVWEMAHHYLTIEGEEDVYYSFIIFEDEPILLYGNDVRVDAFYDSLWRWIPLLPSRGGVTPTALLILICFLEAILMMCLTTKDG